MILITGASGFVGTALLSFLKSKGYQVAGISEDITDIDKLRPYFKDAQLVIHLAAKVSEDQSSTRPGGLFEVNVAGTMNIITLCLEYNCKMIHIGSIATQSRYAISKMVAEDLVRLYARYQGLQAVTIRPCIIYDENTGVRHPYISRYYPLQKLVKDTEYIIRSDDLSRYKVYAIGGLGQRLYIRGLVQWYRRLKRKLIPIKRRLLAIVPKTWFQ